MSNQEVNIIAVVNPTPGKEERILSLLRDMAKEVHEKEENAVQYLITQQLESEGTPEIVMIERYASLEASKQHGNEPHFTQLFATFQQEALMAKPPYIARTVAKGGFDLGRKLI